MTDDRLVTGAKRDADVVEQSLRPQRLAEFIGQEQARANLKVFIEAAKRQQASQAAHLKASTEALRRELQKASSPG